MAEDAWTVLLVLLVVTIWVFGVMLAATIARNKGRDPLLWGFLAAVLSPLLIAAVVAVLPPTDGPRLGPPGAGA